jgi:monoamine oxidase
MAKEKADVAIIGGGVSGIYSAWRLRKADPKRKVVLFEASDHIGGRLLSVQPPDVPNMVAELGGMRILPNTQPLITRLIEVLNELLPPNQRIETYDFPVDDPVNLAYLRGTWLRLSDFTQHPDKVPYHLSFLEKGGTAGSLIVGAIEQIVPGITNASLTEAERREMCQKAEFAGRPLFEQGFWNVLARVISAEAYLLGADAGGYNSTLSNWNAADAIPWYLSDFGIKPEYKGFKQGFQQVPLSLAKLFAQAGGDVRLNAPISGFEVADGRFQIRFKNHTVEANAVILAMPRRALDLLSARSPALQEIQELIASVTPRPLFKLFTTYNNPWWLAAGVQKGRTVTDLPVRQTYYWPTNQGLPAKEGPAMLMASYDDGQNIGFWDGLRPRRRQAWREGQEVAKPEHPFKQASRPATKNPWFKYQASDEMVAEVNRQLGLIHALSYTPNVCNAAFRDWGDDPFGGGWNSWNIGVRSPDVKQKIIQPLGKLPLYICGEAYSDAQGWVEGALQTADMMLVKWGLGPL